MRNPCALAFLLLAPTVADGAVGIVVEPKVYHVPGVGPRVELSMAFLAGTMVATRNAEGFMQARIEALTLIEQAGAIKAFAKTEVLGPERLDSLQTDLIHQESFDLAPGAYELVIELRDLNSSDTTVTHYRAPLAVGALPEGVSLSEIMLAERIETATATRPRASGFWPVPLLSDYLPTSIGEVGFYAEVYGTDAAFGADSLFLLNVQIEDFEHKRVQGAFKRSIRAKAAPVVPVAVQMPIGELPSGNYLAVIEARDRSGTLLARKEAFFQRSNTAQRRYDLESLAALDLSNTFAGAMTDRDSLAEHISSMRPIAEPLERKVIDDRWKDRDIDLMRRFFYSFWMNRNPADPEGAWNAYRAEVIKVNKLFGCRVMRGYQTGRGYVYLRYGPPNTMMDRFNEMGTPPYTIWHYYRAGQFTNRRFVFYQPDLASNCFELLHSEVPGEIQNPQWLRMLHGRNNPPGDVQQRDLNTIEGDRVREFFQMPR